MCTVSYVPTKFGFIITDSRDEYYARKAMLPDYYDELDARLYYPRDTVAGGTWMGASNKNHLICLMNGAFERHDRKESYRKSRGVVVKELLASDDLLEAMRSYDLTDIEPFFAIAISWNLGIQVHEFIWDGQRKTANQHDSQRAGIWSAAMTYDNDQRQEREDMLQDLFHEHSEITSDVMWDFHHRKGTPDYEEIVIDRGVLKTTSVTQFCYHEGKESFRFHDLLEDTNTQTELAW